MKDLQLTIDVGNPELDHDLFVDNFDLALVDEKDAVTQSLRIRLWFFFAEWFLDTRVGVKYFDYAMLKNPDLRLIETLLKETILLTPYVQSLKEFTMTFDVRTRVLSVRFIVNTTYGETEIYIPQI